MAEQNETIEIDLDEIAIQLGLPELRNQVAALTRENVVLRQENADLIETVEQVVAFMGEIQRTIENHLGEPSTTVRMKASVARGKQKFTLAEELPLPPGIKPTSTEYKAMPPEKQNGLGGMVVVSK